MGGAPGPWLQPGPVSYTQAFGSETMDSSLVHSRSLALSLSFSLSAFLINRVLFKIITLITVLILDFRVATMKAGYLLEDHFAVTIE